MSDMRRFARTRTITIVEIFDVIGLGNDEIEKHYFRMAKLECGDPEKTHEKDCVYLRCRDQKESKLIVEIKEEPDDE